MPSRTFPCSSGDDSTGCPAGRSRASPKSHGADTRATGLLGGAMASANGTGDEALAALPQPAAPARWLCRRRRHRRAGPDETLCFSTSAFAGVRMLEEVVGRVRGRLPVFPVVVRGRPPVGIWIRSASWWFPPCTDWADWQRGSRCLLRIAPVRLTEPDRGL
jgi:hypothetical protein